MTQKFWVILYWFSTPKTVRKVLARPKYSVPLYKTRSGFSILTEEYLTFQTVSPTDSSTTQSRVSGKTLCAGTTPAATHIGEEVFIDRNHAGSSKSPLSSGCFASGIPQGRHLQMPGRSWRAGKAVWRWKARRP